MPESQKLLLVEDDELVGRALQRTLSAEGYTIDFVTSGVEGRDRARKGGYDVLVLDLGLGDLPGIDIVRELRREGIGTPILILTGDASEASLVDALDAGADEYVVKPARQAELAARVRALMRRRESASDTQHLVAGGVSLNRLTRSVSVGNTALALSPREFRLLECLMLRPGEVVKRDELLRQVWAMQFDPGTNVIDVLVGRVRRKLATAGASLTIETQRGQGLTLSER